MTNALYVVRGLQKRVEQLQEEVEDLAHSLFQVLQGEKNAIGAFKGALGASAKSHAESKRHLELLERALRNQIRLTFANANLTDEQLEKVFEFAVNRATKEKSDDD